MFNSFHLRNPNSNTNTNTNTNNANKMDPPAATTDASNTNTNTAPSWEMTDAPILVDGKLTYENVTEDDDDCDKRKHEDLQESVVLQETMEASTDSMPALEPARLNIPPTVTVPNVSVGMVQSNTTHPDSPVSLPSVPSIDLSVQASDMDDLSVQDVPDLCSPPSTPNMRETKRARIEVETVTDDDDEDMGVDDDDKIAFGVDFERPQDLFPSVATAAAAAANPTALPLPPQVVVNMEEPAVVLPIETTPTEAAPTETTPTEAAPVANDPDQKKTRCYSWMSIVATILASTALMATSFVIFPNKPASASASMSQQHGPVLVPPTVTPSPSLTAITAVEPVVLVIPDVETTQPEEVEVEAPIEGVLAVAEEAPPAAFWTFLFNSSSTMSVLEKEEELGPTEAVVAVTPEAPTAALLVTEDILPDIPQETVVIEPPAPTKQAPNRWTYTSRYWFLAVVSLLGMSYMGRRDSDSTDNGKDIKVKEEQVKQEQHQVKGILNNHAELASFLSDTGLTKQFGRKCRSPAKSSKRGDDINNNLHNYAGFTMEELKIILDGFNGRTSGHKADLIHAVAQCYRGALSGFKNYQLQELLAIKGLSQSGKKQEMVDRLVEVGF